MRPQATDSLAAWPEEIAPPGGVLVLSGYGLDVRVWRGRLRVRDGIGHDRREAIVHRATGGLRRLVVLGHTGSVTLEAIRWLVDVGAAYLQIDADGRVLAAFGPPGTDRPSLRRVQARALDTPVGVDLAQRLIAEKIAGQAETLAALSGAVAVDDATVAALREATDRLHVAASRDEVRIAEAAAAAAYWGAWSDLPVRFARRDADAVPAHWRAFGARTSPLTSSPRLAANPANAILNYLYALLEGEAAIAARIVGLDPGLGVLHADQPSRDSLAADLMEPVRPAVDRFVGGLLGRRTFAARDFFETREGVCRVTPPLARELAATAREWGRLVGTVAEDVARMLDGLAPTPISGRRRSAARPVAHRHRRHRPVTVRASCLVCGAPTEAGRRTCPGECEASERARQQEAFVAAGAARLRILHADGTNLGMTPDGRQRLASTQSEQIRRAREWQRTHPWPADMGTFAREILPGLASLSAGAIARAIGLSVGYAAGIKRGEVTPHPMWWEALRAVATDSKGA